MLKDIQDLITSFSFTEFKWINPKDIYVAQWVRVKCQFGCNDYGLGACPPNTPSVADCERFFSEFNNAFLIRLSVEADKENYPSAWSKQTTKQLLDLEKSVFKKGYPKAFLLNQTCCSQCEPCSGNRKDCLKKSESRPSPEAFAVDVYQTVKSAGMPIQVITEAEQTINRYAILLID